MDDQCQTICKSTGKRCRQKVKTGYSFCYRKSHCSVVDDATGVDEDEETLVLHVNGRRYVTSYAIVRRSDYFVALFSNKGFQTDRRPDGSFDIENSSGTEDQPYELFNHILSYLEKKGFPSVTQSMWGNVEFMDSLRREFDFYLLDFPTTLYSVQEETMVAGAGEDFVHYTDNIVVKSISPGTALLGHHAVSSGGRIYVVQTGKEGCHRGEMYVYTPSRRTWETVPGPYTRQSELLIATDSALYSFGGSGPKLFEKYDLQTKTWTALRPKRRNDSHFLVACVVDDAYIYFFKDFGKNASVVKYNIKKDTWSCLTYPRLKNTFCPRYSFYMDNQVYLVSQSGQVYTFDPQTEKRNEILHVPVVVVSGPVTECGVVGGELMIGHAGGVVSFFDAKRGTWREESRRWPDTRSMPFVVVGDKRSLSSPIPLKPSELPFMERIGHVTVTDGKETFIIGGRFRGYEPQVVEVLPTHEKPGYLMEHTLPGIGKHSVACMVRKRTIYVFGHRSDLDFRNLNLTDYVNYIWTCDLGSDERVWVRLALELPYRMGIHRSAIFDEETNTIKLQSQSMELTLELDEGGRTVEKICYTESLSNL
jgi:hypothetical protein